MIWPRRRISGWWGGKKTILKVNYFSGAIWFTRTLARCCKDQNQYRFSWHDTVSLYLEGILNAKKGERESFKIKKDECSLAVTWRSFSGATRLPSVGSPVQLCHILRVSSVWSWTRYILILHEPHPNQSPRGNLLSILVPFLSAHFSLFLFASLFLPLSLSLFSSLSLFLLSCFGLYAPLMLTPCRRFITISDQLAYFYLPQLLYFFFFNFNFYLVQLVIWFYTVKLQLFSLNFQFC